MRPIIALTIISAFSCGYAFAQTSGPPVMPGASGAIEKKEAASATATSETQPDAGQAGTKSAADLTSDEGPSLTPEEAQKQLDRIGNLHFVWKGISKTPYLAFDGGAPKPAESTVLTLETLPAGLIANYRYQGQPDFLPLALGGEENISVTLPYDVNLIVVQIVICADACEGAGAENPPLTCVEKHPASSRGKGSPGANCKEFEAAMRELFTSECLERNRVQGSGRPLTDAECSAYIVFSRGLVGPQVEIRQDGQGNPETARYLLPAFIITAGGLQISNTLLRRDPNRNTPVYVLDGTPLSDYYLPTSSEFAGGETQWNSFPLPDVTLEGWDYVQKFHIDRYPSGASCLLYNAKFHDELDIVRPGISAPTRAVDNGIFVAAPKVFDTFSLRQMLSNTASQLGAMSGFNQANITNAYGAIQGITRDTGYLSAQITTVPTPTISSTAVTGGTGSNTSANSLTFTNGSTGAQTTITCPPGTMPAVGTSGVPACAAQPAAGLPGTTGSGNSSLSSTLNVTQGSTGTTQTIGSTGVQTTNQQNTVTSTSNGQGGTIAPVPVSTAPASPTNLGYSASDMLAEQVQLNSQITTLRLLLQGALSDQYLVKGSRAVGTRQQTTVGFAISLNPPHRFRHAVAEVRVWIDSRRGVDPVSVMNLLPADKTYNVARITSHQNAFGAGAVVEAVNIGAATGRSKDRLYLVKDIDTVALQYRREKPTDGGADRLPRSVQEHIRDAVRQAIIWQSIQDECADDPVPASNAIVFGWQFRPVLGADYVQAGQRLVFAQLALPIGLGDQFAPLVHIQTRWREYDPKRRVVGAVYSGSCSITEDPNPITVVSPLRVHRARWEDMGGGVLKLSASGDFFSSSFAVLSGPNTTAPVMFDGRNIQVFGNAGSLLLSGDLQLVAEDGRITRMGMGTIFGPRACGIAKATMTALPRPDGNSVVEATIDIGDKFLLESDGAPRPLFLIGTQVFGLHETPFLDPPGRDRRCALDPGTGKNRCTYRFIAPTDVLRAAGAYTVKDLSWKDFQWNGTIEIAPTFTGLASLGSAPASAASECPQKPPECPAKPKSSPAALYSVSGTDFNKVRNHATWNCIIPGCINLYAGFHQLELKEDNFQVLSNSTAVLQVSTPKSADSNFDYKSLRFIYWSATGESVEWDVSLPSETKAAVTASTILNVGDSMQLTFNNVDVPGTPTPLLTVMFDGAPVALDAKAYDKAKKTLTVQITTAMTSKPGHKEMTLTYTPAPVGGKPQTTANIQLPFEVTRR